MSDLEILAAVGGGLITYLVLVVLGVPALELIVGTVISAIGSGLIAHLYVNFCE